MTRAATHAAFILALASAVPAQTARDGAARAIELRGRIVADDSGKPLARARVTLSGPAFGAPAVVTDADGRFLLSSAPGAKSIVVTRTGYARVEVVPAPSGPLEVRLVRGATVSGRVVDDRGEPVIAARVTAESSPTPAGAASLAAALTDDRGEYRLHGLPQGALKLHVVTAGAAPATQGSGDTMLRGPNRYTTFYPGVRTYEEGAELVIRPGEDRRRIDFQVLWRESGDHPFSAGFIFGLWGRPARAPQSNDLSRAAIRGRVLGGDGLGLSSAEVALVAPRAGVTRVTSTDARGYYAFTELPPARYQINASKAGYFPAWSPSPDSRPLTVDVARDEEHDSTDLRLMPWGVVSGRIVDESGEPVADVRVQAGRVRYEAGRRQLAFGSAGALSDETGVYRLFGLQPGAYIISASAAGLGTGDLPGYARTFFPSGLSPRDAAVVTVGPSEVVGIDVSLSRAPTFRVAGQVFDPAGAGGHSGSLQLVPSVRNAGVVDVRLGARIQSDGTFEFPNVSQGQYVVQAYRGRVNGSTDGAFASVAVAVVDRDVTGLRVQTFAGSSIAGRVIADAFDGAAGPDFTRIEVVPQAADADQSPPGNPPTSNATSDGRFALAGLHGLRRLAVRHLPAGWALKAIRAGGVDVTDRPLPTGAGLRSFEDVEVLLTNRVSRIIGNVVGDSGRPTASSPVLVFSTDRDRWYDGSRFLARAVSDDTGAFTVTGLPFGTYYVVAAQWPVDGADAWQDPAFLESLALRSTTVAVAEGESRAVRLQPSPR